jgi:hypothetical protein
MVSWSLYPRWSSLQDQDTATNRIDIMHKTHTTQTTPQTHRESILDREARIRQQRQAPQQVIHTGAQSQASVLLDTLVSYKLDYADILTDKRKLRACGATGIPGLHDALKARASGHLPIDEDTAWLWGNIVSLIVQINAELQDGMLGVLTPLAARIREASKLVALLGARLDPVAKRVSIPSASDDSTPSGSMAASDRRLLRALSGPCTGGRYIDSDLPFEAQESLLCEDLTGLLSKAATGWLPSFRNKDLLTFSQWLCGATDMYDNTAPLRLEDEITGKVTWHKAGLQRLADLRGFGWDSGHKDEGNLDNIIHIMLYDAIKDYYRCSREDVSCAWAAQICATSWRVNTVANRLKELASTVPVPDSDPYLAFAEAIRADDPDFAAVLIRKWIMQAVVAARNTMESPVQVEHVLVLVGAQGIGKTTLMREVLKAAGFASDTYASGRELNPEDKDDRIAYTHAWINEIGEIDRWTGNARLTHALKNFLSCSIDTDRAPYARTAVARPRRSVAIGTSNKPELLTDDTGSRRFWIIQLSGDTLFDFTLIRKVAPAMFAEAARAIDAGESWHLTADEYRLTQLTNQRQFSRLGKFATAIEELYCGDGDLVYRRVRQIADELELRAQDMDALRDTLKRMEGAGIIGRAPGRNLAYMLKRPVWGALPIDRQPPRLP